MINLKNLNIILTGATGVIGNSILDKLISAGSNVLATGTNEQKLKIIEDKYKDLNVLKFDIRMMLNFCCTKFTQLLKGQMLKQQ